MNSRLTPLVAAAGLALAGCSGHALRAADPATPVTFPADHAAHADAQTEWWHLHGHMSDEQGRRYDWFMAFIRQHTDHDSVAKVPVSWFVDPMQTAFLSITDRQAGRFHVRDKYAWPDTWAASASHTALELEHDSWSVRSMEDGWIDVRGATRQIGLRLRLRSAKPESPMGRGGYLNIPPRSSHYYYSTPRMQAEGALEIDGERRAVTGDAWLKHEWGFLYSDHLAGFVWFGAQLSSGVELVIALIFDRDWNLAPGAFAAVVEADGAATPLAVRAIDVSQSGDTWRSPRTDVVYPTGWHLKIPERDAWLDLKAVVDAQEMLDQVEDIF